MDGDSTLMMRHVSTARSSEHHPATRVGHIRTRLALALVSDRGTASIVIGPSSCVRIAPPSGLVVGTAPAPWPCFKAVIATASSSERKAETTIKQHRGNAATGREAVAPGSPAK